MVLSTTFCGLEIFENRPILRIGSGKAFDMEEGVKKPRPKWAARLAMAIEASPLDQPAIARHLGVAQQTISSWVTGRTQPKFEQFVALCALLNTTPNWVLIGPEPDKNQTAKI